jgi:hypothetical protein
MKFIWAMVVITLISAVLGVGMLLGSHGHGWWVLALGVVGFLGLFVRFGCRTH